METRCKCGNAKITRTGRCLECDVIVEELRNDRRREKKTRPHRLAIGRAQVRRHAKRKLKRVILASLLSLSGVAELRGER